MADTLVPPGAPAPARARRSTAMRVVIAVSVVAVVAAGLCVYLVVRHVERARLDRHYGPVVSGPAAGAYSLRNIDPGPEGLIGRLSTDPGATAVAFETLHNDGSHAVVITSIATDAVVSRVRWSTYSPTTTNLGDPAPWRTFPATVAPHGTIRLLVTIHRPATCAGKPYGNQIRVTFVGGLEVRWTSLLASHETAISWLGTEGIQVC
jgi:hypothetical protein